MPELLKAVAYCRYSSHLQRGESVTAQLRAIEKYADAHGYVLLNSYVDEAQSGKTDDRIAFQKLMLSIKTELKLNLIFYRMIIQEKPLRKMIILTVFLIF